MKEIGRGNMRSEGEKATGVLLTSKGFSSSLFSLCIMLRGGSSTCNIGSTVTQTLLTHPSHLTHQSYPPHQHVTHPHTICNHQSPHLHCTHTCTLITGSCIHPHHLHTHSPPTHPPTHPPTLTPSTSYVHHTQHDVIADRPTAVYIP